MKKISFLILAVFIFCLNNRSYSQTESSKGSDKIKKIEVTGSAEMKVVPDEIYVSFTLQEYYNKQKVKTDIDHIQKDFLDKCAKANISKDRIQIQNMSGFDNNAWYWQKKKETPELMASTTYTIKFGSASDIDKLVNTLDENATQSLNISKTSHSKMEDFRKEIKIKALQAAKAKAQYLCESIGEKVGNAIFIQEIDNESPLPMYKSNIQFETMSSVSSANEGINFQEITIRYSVLARFEIQ